MKSAPGKPGRTTILDLPPATLHARQCTPKIRTSEPGSGAWVKAEYTSVDEYNAPHEAPIYARMKPAVLGRGRHNGKWLGEVVLQTFAHNEVDALDDLLESMEKLGMRDTDEYRAAKQITAQLGFAIESGFPWELQPLGLRGRKPPPARVKLTTHEGKKHFYRDSEKPHRDPNCTCVFCAPPQPPPEEDTTE